MLWKSNLFSSVHESCLELLIFHSLNEITETRPWICSTQPNLPDPNPQPNGSLLCLEKHIKIKKRGRYLPEPISTAGEGWRVWVTRRHENAFGHFLPPQPLTSPRSTISSQTKPNKPITVARVCHAPSKWCALGEWVASIESLAADLLTGVDFGLFWLVVEPRIEFKEAVKGGCYIIWM